jgi:hypothetical protein
MAMQSKIMFISPVCTSAWVATLENRLNLTHRGNDDYSINFNQCGSLDQKVNCGHAFPVKLLAHICGTIAFESIQLSEVQTLGSIAAWVVKSLDFCDGRIG